MQNCHRHTLKLKLYFLKININLNIEDFDLCNVYLINLMMLVVVIMIVIMSDNDELIKTILFLPIHLYCFFYQLAIIAHDFLTFIHTTEFAVTVLLISTKVWSHNSRGKLCHNHAFSCCVL